jgi:chromosome segregation protein
MLSLETRNLWPPVIDHISVDKGYEKALGAALGDDLDAPVDARRPCTGAEVARDATDPALPQGAEALARFVKAPAQLARRLAQIGVVDRELALPARSRPASGWYRVTAICGAGMDTWRRPMP